MKKHLSLWVMLLICTFPTFAYDFTVDGIYYNKLGGDSVEVTHEADYYYYVSGIYTGSVVIPAAVTFEEVTYRVTKIGDNAFYDCSNLTAITIGENISSFGEYAFMNCYELTSITWNAKHCADFENEYSTPFTYVSGQIISFTFGDNVEYIPAYLCAGMKNITSITIPENVVSIGDQLFGNSYSSQLTTVVWNAKHCADFDVYNSAPFEGSPVTSFTIGEDVTYIPANLCRNMQQLTSIIIPDGVTAIGDFAFYYCDQLRDITLPESVTTIGEETFYDCSLTSITIPKNVAFIGQEAFGSCSNLGTIEVAAGNSTYHSANNCLIETITKTLIQGCKNSTIPADGSVTIIGKSAFRACYGLTEITFPDAITIIREDAFHYCEGLTSIVIGENVTTIGEGAFDDCENVESIIISNSVTTIGPSAFFMEASFKLKSIVIGNKVDSIGEEAFFGCSPVLESLIVNEGNKHYHSSGNCLIETASKKLILGCSNSIIPADGSVESIEPYAFYFCQDVVQVQIPEGVKTIGYAAFLECPKLSKVIISNTVTTISEYAFGYCNNLTSIILGSGVQTIGSDAFDGELGFQSVTSLAAVPPLFEDEDSYVFAEPEFSTLYVPAGSVEAYKAAEGWKEFGKIEAISSITALTLKTDRVTINPGDRYYLNSIIAPEDAQKATLVWESDNPDVVSVTDGLVIAHAEGKAIITLSTLDTQLSAQCTIVVAEAGENGENNVVIDPDSESVNFSWPAVEEAASYVFVIYADAAQTEKICTLTFDDQGYLVRIDFLRNSPARQPSAQRGFNFVVTGLAENTTYTYTLDSYDSENEIIERKAGSFTTSPSVTTDVETLSHSVSDEAHKVFKNGTIYIIYNGEKYTVDGRLVL